MFTATEALGLVMAVVEGPHGAADAADPIGSALGKIIRVLPEAVASSAESVRHGSARRTGPVAVPDPGTTATLIRAGRAGLRVRLAYRRPHGPAREMEVDPWAVVIRHGLWYLLCWSHTADARRVLRADRVAAVDALADTFEPPAGRIAPGSSDPPTFPTGTPSSSPPSTRRTTSSTRPSSAKPPRRSAGGS